MHWVDPAQLPLVIGIIERFIVNGQGDIDGLVLNIGASTTKLVHFPTHMGEDVRTALKQGDPVAVRGVKPRDADIIAAVSLECSDGIEIIDRGPPKHAAPASRPFRPSPMSASGTVRLTLFTPKGKVRGALLDDGTILRMALAQAEQIAERLRPRVHIEVDGAGRETEYGRVIEVHHVATPASQYTVVRKRGPSRRKAAQTASHDRSDGHGPAGSRQGNRGDRAE
jgi:hypothetical protein